MSLLNKTKFLLAKYGQLIVDAYDKTYTPEGVDLYNETLNGNSALNMRSTASKQ